MTATAQRIVWKPGAQIPKSLDPVTVYQRLMEIERRDGHITPVAVVDDARPKASPFHPAFEWDDQTAAEEYRLVQARKLIRSVVVKSDDSTEAVSVRAFVIVKDEDDTRSYWSTLRAMRDDATRDQVLNRAQHELETWSHRYRDLVEFASVHAVIHSVSAGRKRKAA